MRSLTVVVPAALLMAGLSPQASAQCQLAELHSAIPGAPFGFGEPLGLSDDWVVVGSQMMNEQIYQTFQRMGDVWVAREVLVPRVGTTFSTRMDFRERTLAIGLGDDGTYGQIDPNAPNPAGEVEVYDVAIPGGFPVVTLTPSDGVAAQGFGSSLDVGQDRIIVGSPFAPAPGDSLPGTDPLPSGGPNSLPFFPGGFAGAAYVYERSGTTWVETAILRLANSDDFVQFGEGVAVDGERIAVGASQSPFVLLGGPGGGIIAPPTGIVGGEIHVYDKRGPDWVHAKVIKGANLGLSLVTRTVVLEGDTIVCAAFLESTDPFNEPAVNVVASFRLGSGGWALEQVIRPTDAQTFDRFGTSLDLRAGKLIVSSPAAGGTGSAEGAAYLFERVGGTWMQTGRIQPGGQPLQESFGRTVAVTSQLAAVGDSGLGMQVPAQPGAAFIYGIGANCNSGSARPYCTAALNSTGRSATLREAGSSFSVSAGEFSLGVTGAPGGSAGILIAGDRAAYAPFGNGFRCVGNVHRVGPAGIDAGGSALIGVDVLGELGPAALATTWNFQLVYRDGASGWNTTDALAVEFVP